MARRKEFPPGEAVEVQRDVGKPWEPATCKCRSSMRGWHHVNLPAHRYINTMSGTECSPDDSQAVATTLLIIPSQRVRKKERP